MNFTQRLRTIQKAKNSLVCVGLDTDPAKIPQLLRIHEEPALEFNRRIIEATQDLVCAYKINLAFYESMGMHGWSTLQKTLACIPEGVIAIGDAKRGDIGNTAEMYARSLLIDHRFGATTVNPYMGFDSVEPFIRNPEQGAFVLAVTSNPGARDFQYLKSGGRPFYEQIIRRVRSWNTKKNCGLVVGATRAKELQRIRRIVPDMPILIPGVGAQGGNLESAVRYGCDSRGFLAVVNASRSILYASKGEDFADAARASALALREEINRYRAAYFRRPR
jgi:orotidine-5'-phosphate decarboxylase